ncbi:MAG TPA: GNAT family N-acetyltransferase [Pyrinomonadaceae bacterium]|nr:GNAT family N-acetyltransferase [Pyrinomonadaceae bacterium]
MPRIAPLDKLVNKARRLRDDHKERHRPSGFGFALADRVDYLDPVRWDALTAQSSMFLSRRYLRVLEEAGPENLHQRYAMVFRGDEPVAAVAAQSVSVALSRVSKSSKSKVSKVTAPLERLEEQMLVCGNLLSWGQHGVAFAPGEDTAALWPAVAEALYRIRRADKLLGTASFVMIKDITDGYADGAGALSRFSYRQLETEPNMVLEISPQWKTYDDYMSSLTSRYRKAAKQIEKDFTAGGLQLTHLDNPADVAKQADAMHALYLQTHRNARVRLVTLRPSFIPALTANLGSDLRCTIAERDGQVLGFVTTVRDGATAVGYYIGFDREVNASAPIYFRLLQAVVDHAIQLGCSRLSLGRTALEPKARLGARPDPMRIWIRHRIPMLNVLVRALLHTISHHDEAPERNPFK